MIEQGLNVVAGVDLGDKHSQLCVIDLDGNLVDRKKLRILSSARNAHLAERKKRSTSPAAFERYFGGWAAMRLVFEAGAHANWICRSIERLEHEPLIAAASSSGLHPVQVKFRNWSAPRGAQENERSTLTQVSICLGVPQARCLGVSQARGLPTATPASNSALRYTRRLNV
jgi:hypothetical protein